MENKHLFMDNANVFLIGAVVGVVIETCLMLGYNKSNQTEAEKKLEAYKQYYKCTEILLDSLDGTRNLDLMDTDLCTDYGAGYLKAKSIVDSLER